MAEITVMNVEDDSSSRQATSELLRLHGFRVVEAATGSDALSLIAELQPQLVILDVKLPDVSGHEVCRRLKTHAATSSIPVLQVSASFVSGTDRVRGLESGADAYLVKPVEPEELIATVRALVRMREAEEARRESEARYQLLFEGNSLPTCIFDLESLAFLAVNQAGIRRYGYTREEFLSMTIKDILPSEDIPAMEDYLSRIPKGVANATQWRHLRKDGTLIEVEVVWHELIYRGRHALLVLAKDITDRKRSEKERESLLAKERIARRQAQAANRAKDEFLAVVSHELRAPLNAILGWARILRTAEVDEATLAHAIEIIERSARTQSRLIEDILDTARIASGKLRLDIQPVDLTAVIKNAADVLQPASEAKGIDVRLDMNVRSEVITGDPERVQQIVWNLLSNAIKFTPDGGRVEVGLRRVDPHARITVSDTGKGISPEYLPFIFDRFEQADGSSTRRHGGLGLGLSLVSNLVELHGGTVYAASSGEGQGATFTVNLPLRAVRPKAAEGEWPGSSLGFSGDSAVLKGVWALVVDDEADARDLIGRLLEQYGARVTAVESAAEALKVLTRGQSFPDILVSDVSMPEEDGYALIRRVRNLELDRGRIPAIALTAYGRPIDRVRALRAGFQVHIPKPVEPAELAAVIATLTGHVDAAMSAN